MKIVGLFVLVAAGASVGLLLYTDKGKKVRKNIANAAIGWTQNAKALFVKSHKNLEDIKKMISDATGLTNEAQKRILEILDESIKTNHTVGRMKGVAQQ